MKTKIMIEVDTKLIDWVLPEEGQSEDDFNTPEELAELKKFREEFTNDVHTRIINLIKLYVDEQLEEDFLDDECYVEGRDELRDYTKITVE
jgi:hypothetical protein